MRMMIAKNQLINATPTKLGAPPMEICAADQLNLKHVTCDPLIGRNTGGDNLERQTLLGGSSRIFEGMTEINSLTLNEVNTSQLDKGCVIRRTPRTDLIFP